MSAVYPLEEEASRFRLAISHRHGVTYNIDPEDCPLHKHVEREEWMLLEFVQYLGPKCEECRREKRAYHPCQPDDEVSWEEVWRRRGFTVEWSDISRDYVIHRSPNIVHHEPTVQKVNNYIDFQLLRDAGPWAKEQQGE